MPRAALLRASILKPQKCGVILAKRESSTENFTPLWTAERAVSAGMYCSKTFKNSEIIAFCIGTISCAEFITQAQ